MLKRFLIISVIYTIFSLIFLKTVWGFEQVAGQSAQISSFDVFSAEASRSSFLRLTPKFDFRPLKLSAFFVKNNSLLKEYSFYLVKKADEYDLDYRLFPAISGVESGFCKAYIFSTNNCVGWGGGYIAFKSMEEQIEVVLKALKEKYVDQGLLTVSQIGLRYAADSSWSFKVERNMEEIEKTGIF